MLHFVPGWLLELNTIFLFLGLAAKGKAARGILKISLFYSSFKFQVYCRISLYNTFFQSALLAGSNS